MGAGPIGVMHTIAAKAAGAKKILVSEQSPERLRKAAQAGAHRVVNFLEEKLQDVVASETDGSGADVIVVAVGVGVGVSVAV